MREWSDGTRRVVTAAFAVLGVGLFVVVLFAWTLRRPVGRTTKDGEAPPAELGLPFKHGPKERRQLRDLSSLADTGGTSSALPGMSRAKDRDEPVQVQPGDGPVSVSGPGGVTWDERYPASRIVYVTSPGSDIESESPPPADTATPEPAPPSKEPDSVTPRPARASPGSDDPNAAFDPPGQYR
jgi:hypothetical protein